MVNRASAVNGELPELGSLLALLHRADDPFSTVAVAYRLWVHRERSFAAFGADMEARKASGYGVATIHSARRSNAAGEDEPVVASEEVVRIWRSEDRYRQEVEGGERDGSYLVRDGKLWWNWDRVSGARSNEDDPEHGLGVGGEELAIMLDPTPLLGLLRFRVTGRAVIAGRPVVVAEALPRLGRSRAQAQSVRLHLLGSGAERYELSVDEQLGVLMRVVALRDDEPFREVTTIAITFDEPITEDRFRFEPPAGETIQPSRERQRPEQVSVIEAQQLAPFTVLIPDRVPADWHPHCIYIAASERPPRPAQVWLNYRSDDGHQSVSIIEMAAADRPADYDQMMAGDGWQDLPQEGTVVRVTRAGTQTQAHVERDGTFVFLMSENLGRDELATIAARLKPAPNTGSI
ncbi:MAG: hypothetical protein ABSC56_06865 [Solirubrobacteraceae bacterium]